MCQYIALQSELSNAWICIEWPVPIRFNLDGFTRQVTIFADTPYEAAPSYDCRPKNTCPQTGACTACANAKLSSCICVQYFKLRFRVRGPRIGQ